jgi:hypothetical protein
LLENSDPAEIALSQQQLEAAAPAINGKDLPDWWAYFFKA